MRSDVDCLSIERRGSFQFFCIFFLENMFVASPLIHCTVVACQLAFLLAQQ